MTTRTLTPAIADLVAGIDAVIGRDLPAIDTARLVADALADTVTRPDLLTDEQCLPNPECYRQHVLHVDPLGVFSVVALVWLPGQRTAIHDHVSWCVVGVLRGAEEETLYRLVDNGLDEAHLVITGHSVNGEGSTSFFVPPGDIHEVRNATGEKAISLHVYGADIAVLGGSIRRRYDLPVRTG